MDFTDTTQFEQSSEILQFIVIENTKKGLIDLVGVQKVGNTNIS